MLKIKPNCEVCDKDLPPDSEDARICSYECTFCADCVASLLANVCPNCGGGLVPRPIRPANAHRKGVSLAFQPASTERVHSPYSHQQIREFAASLQKVAVTKR